MLIPLKVHKHTCIKHPFSQHAAAINVKNHIKYPGGIYTQQNSIQGGSAQRPNPLPFLIPLLTEKVTPYICFLLTNGTCIRFTY